ncbi:TetR/AcrR family transcriptional regulator [Metaclostridioides mangenotii]|uniref:AcrR family transcriptional regulator n=1 Tax=Metaclostridioides mangenotii TaxID=1540 RepID=A0ABS4EA54_9FIRM|nr:TetR/AcrR family transcriptional regulator [Clostridioides mangenotii]MBP1854814.1 AcrR family transcriptional regulator [Clostridioides mangenotii]
MNKKNVTKEKLLDSASFIIQNRGMAHFTLESVASHAGVSKGGLLYHFPNKEALITGILDRLIDSYDNEIAKHIDKFEDRKGEWSRAYMEYTFKDMIKDKDMGTALIASVFSNPDLLNKLKIQYENWQHNIENDGIDPVTATIVRLVSDGLWFAEIFGLAPIDEDLRIKVFNKLQNIIEEGDN